MRSQSAPDPHSQIPGWTLSAAGLFLGPILAALVFLLVPRGQAPTGLSPAAVAVASLATLMVVWWMTEAIPTAATALLPIPMLPLLGVCTAKEAAAPYGSELVFLFLGGFLLGEAMQTWGLHKRFALRVLVAVGPNPRRIVLGFMFISCAISMWVSNTATTIMLVPLGLSVIAIVRSHAPASAAAERDHRHLAVCVMLAIAYGSSIGGVGTLIGTPPNLVLASNVESLYGRKISVGEWMRLGVPMVLVLGPLTWAYLVYIAFPIRARTMAGDPAPLRDELRRLGPMSRPERIVLAAFVFAAASWVLRPQLINWLGLWRTGPNGKRIDRLDDTAIALLAAIVLFLIPAGAKHDSGGQRKFVLDWNAAQRLPWGVLLFFGGGLSLADAMSRTGVDQVLGAALSGLNHVPKPLLVLLITAAVVFLTEIASNVAVATALMPVMAGAAQALHVHPYLLMFPACLAASLAFMLPVGTPPNAIVYATGHVSMRQMIRAGFRLNLLSIATITIVVYIFGSWLLGTDLLTDPGWSTK